MKIIKKTETLQATAKTGKIKFWLEQVVTDGKDFYTQSEYWQTDKDGKESKHTLSVPYIVKPTNVGRANERNAKEQALFQIESDFKKQIDKGYDLIGKKNTKRKVLPMLANKYLEKKHKVQFPVYAQFKYNGVRNLYETNEGAWSRKAKLFIPECVKHLKFDTNGIIVDGELMIPHSQNTFEESMAAVKKFRVKDEIDKKTNELKPASNKLWYFIYDCVLEGKTFKERYEHLKKLSKNFPKQVKLAETVILNNEDEVEKFLKSAIKAGYEGAIIRDMNGMYEVGHRSNTLLKYKLFMDEEFKIIDVIEGEGNRKGSAIFVLITKEGKTFHVNPNGNEKVRKQYFKDRKKLIGKLATVSFQAWTDDKIPYIAKNVVIRDYE